MRTENVRIDLRVYLSRRDKENRRRASNPFRSEPTHSSLVIVFGARESHVLVHVYHRAATFIRATERDFRSRGGGDPIPRHRTHPARDGHALSNYSLHAFHSTCIRELTDIPSCMHADAAPTENTDRPLDPI